LTDGLSMELRHQFKKAERTILRLSAQDRQTLAAICGEIRLAEAALNKNAAPLLHRCIESCAGLCCRNIRLTEIIGFYDFIYLLTAVGSLKGTMADCLRHESLYSGDCIFLKNGKGPCIFPSDARPRLCIISFCFDVAPVRNHIRAVNSGFNRLSRFIRSKRLTAMAQRLANVLLPKTGEN
jgi:hypothetical protein